MENVMLSIMHVSSAVPLPLAHRSHAKVNAAGRGKVVLFSIVSSCVKLAYGNSKMDKTRLYKNTMWTS